MSEQGL